MKWLNSVSLAAARRRAVATVSACAKRAIMVGLIVTLSGVASCPSPDKCSNPTVPGCGVPAPTLVSVTPNSGVQGTTVAVTLVGTNFVAGATTVAFDSAGITVNTVSVTSGTSLTANFVIAANAKPGAYVMTITTAGGALRMPAFTVTAAPAPTISSFTANPATITVGQSSTLSWSGIINATTCLIQNLAFAPPVGTGYSVSCSNGSMAVSPTYSTPYMLTAGGPGGGATAELVVNVTGVAATQIAQYAGSTAGTAGAAVATPPSVMVGDASGNLVSGVNVTFAVGSGGGSITGPTQTTNASGIATVGSWTLGTVAGVNTLTATSGTLMGSPVTFTAYGTAGGGLATQLGITTSPSNQPQRHTSP